MFKHLRAMFILAAMTACFSSPSMAQEGSPVTLVINFEASDEGHPEFAGIMAGVSEAMTSEPGFISAVVYQNVDNPNAYVLQEVWASKKLHGEHFDRIVESGDWAHIKSLLRSEPLMGYYQKKH